MMQKAIKQVLVVAVVLSMITYGPWPVSSAKEDWSAMEELSSGISTRLLSIAWNPCREEALLVGFDGALLRYTPTSIDVVQTSSNKQLSAVSWKPDCTEALIVGQAGTVLRYKDGNITALNSNSTSLLQDITWTNDGKAVIAAGLSGLLWYDGVKFYPQSLPLGGLEVFGIAWKPNGDYGIVVGQKLTIFKFNWNGVTKVTPPLGVSQEISLYKASWRPDGSSVTMVGKNGTVLDWDGSTFTDVTSGGGGLVVTFLDIDWRPTGEFALICGDTGTVITYRGENDWPYTPASNVWGLLYGVDWSSDGKRALVVGNNGVVLRYPGKTAASASPQFNPVVIGALVLLFVLVAIGITYLYFEDRRALRKEELKKQKRRSKHHGRKSRHRH